MNAKSPVRVIADVHGHLDMFGRAVADIKQVILLGDLVDRGPDSPGCLRLALDLIDEGRARLVRSNHDDKLFRALLGRKVVIGPNLEKTLADLKASADADALIARFVDRYPRLPFILEHGPYVMAHGAVSTSYFEAGDDESRAAKHMALYGEVDGTTDVRGRPVRRYDWVDRIPRGRTAIVGHDRRGGERVIVQDSVAGGRAFFLDTGCGKGGPLSYMDLPAETIGQVAAA